jgi:alpha-ribazole phosphatase/probable phosphoglycerate mutase
MLIYLIRHAEPEDAEGRCLGHADHPLSGAGRRGVGALADSWPAPPTRVVASDLARARETAAVLAARWGREPRLEPRLREMHFGAWDGRRWDAVRADDAARLDAWTAAWSTAAVPDGEAFPDVAARVAAWWVEERRTLTPDDRIAVVAHSGSLRALLCHLLPLPLHRAFQFRVDYARVSALSLAGDRAELHYLNADRVPA